MPFICVLLTVFYSIAFTQGATVNVKRSVTVAPDELTGRSLQELFPPEEENNLALPRESSLPDVSDNEHVQRLGSSALSLNSILQASREQLNRTLQNQKQQLIKRWNEMMNKLKKVIFEKIQSFLNFNENLAASVTQLLQQMTYVSTASINHIQGAIKIYLETLEQNFGLKTINSDD